MWKWAKTGKMDMICYKMHMEIRKRNHDGSIGRPKIDKEHYQSKKVSKCTRPLGTGCALPLKDTSLNSVHRT
jgi:hypothetical protein